MRDEASGVSMNVGAGGGPGCCCVGLSAVMAVRMALEGQVHVLERAHSCSPRHHDQVALESSEQDLGWVGMGDA